MTITIPEFNYGDEAQNNIDEYLNEAVSDHLDKTEEDLSRMSEGDLQEDVTAVTNKAFSEDFDEVNLPNGETWTREDIELAVRNTIEARY